MPEILLLAGKPDVRLHTHCDIRLPLAKRRRGERDLRPCIDADDLKIARRLYPGLSCIAGHNVKPYGGLGTLGPDIRRSRTAGRLYEPLWPAFCRNCVYKPVLRFNEPSVDVSTTGKTSQ